MKAILQISLVLFVLMILSCVTYNSDQQQFGTIFNADNIGVSDYNHPNRRSRESISEIFDINKFSVYAIFNKYWRRDFRIEGRIIFELTITPSGIVKNIRIASSELENVELENELMKLIGSFEFGSEDVTELLLTYPILFLPP